MLKDNSLLDYNQVKQEIITEENTTEAQRKRLSVSSPTYCACTNKRWKQQLAENLYQINPTPADTIFFAMP